MSIPSLFNCSNDMALAAHVRQYVPPKRIQQMEADLADLARVWEGTRFAGPWGWSLATKQRYRQMGVAGELLPSDEWLEEVRRLSSREFACRYVKELLGELKDERLLGEEMRWVDKQSPLWDALTTSKPTWGTSVDRRGARRQTDVGHVVFEDVKAGVWHSWMHHSSFSSADPAELVVRINRTTHEVAAFLREADVLIVTFGTAIIYRLKETGMLVANCHKQPDNLFVREWLNAYDIVDQWQMLLQLLESVNPKLKVIFTVSPIRHKRDGYHVNQISKGILLQAVDETLQTLQTLPSPSLEGGSSISANEETHGETSEQGNHSLPTGRVRGGSYFPSYEIMMDELRDYRFYADDMIHPSGVAVEYIWQRFQDTYFDNKTKDAVAKAAKEWRQSQHRQIVKNV